jgi:hypothetical protein
MRYSCKVRILLLIGGLSDARRDTAQPCVNVIPAPALGLADGYWLRQDAALDKLIDRALCEVELVG